MLRASAQATGQEIDYRAVTTDDGGGGVPHGALLTAFVEAVMGEDTSAHEDARHKLREAVGDAGLVDACAVIANYNALDRVADATGIPLEAQKEATTVDLRADLGIDAFAAK